MEDSLNIDAIRRESSSGMVLFLGLSSISM